MKGIYTESMDGHQGLPEVSSCKNNQSASAAQISAKYLEFFDLVDLEAFETKPIC